MSLSENRKKTASVLVRVDPDDLQILRTKAADVGLTLPTYLISCGLGRRTRSHMDGQIIHELQRLAFQQRTLNADKTGADESQVKMIFAAIVAAIERIGA